MSNMYKTYCGPVCSLKEQNPSQVNHSPTGNCDSLTNQDFVNLLSKPQTPVNKLTYASLNEAMCDGLFWKRDVEI